MNGILITALVFLFIVFFALYSIYANLIKARNKVQEAFSSVDVQMQKRYDLIPNILTIAQKFLDHEKGLMNEITELRTQAMKLKNGLNNINKKIEIDKEFTDKMGQFMIAVENYPQLKSDQTMVTAMQSYNEVEEHISAARRFYNSAANELKNAVEIFPSSVIASMLNIKAYGFFKADERAKKSINASDYLK